ncbi:MAG: chloride channel protein [Halofilum sp. (in: g-proteobacteria)]|nr:chloride channel protein [Halofilum sp. (in: g-proteobacteria)]
MAIALVQNLLFHGRFDRSTSMQHVPLAPSPWGVGIVVVPVIGALGVAWITRRLSAEVRGSGVPEVLYALHYHGGRMRPQVAGLKAVASALSIGSGASVGREGPIVQIGSVLGAGVGLLARIPAHQRVVLVAGGAAAGIAATFNAPLGGLAFAIELLLISVSARNVALVGERDRDGGHLVRGPRAAASGRCSRSRRSAGPRAWAAAARSCSPACRSGSPPASPPRRSSAASARSRMPRRR